jgi:3-dehydroquinate synthase
VERDLEHLLAGKAEALGPVVTAAAAAKVAVVERDPTEKGERRVLNLGHTLAHALESCLGYRGLRHGEAVAYGLLFVLRLAVPRGFPEAAAARVRDLLQRFALPPLATLPGAAELQPDELLAAMARDKKARERGLVWVLPTALGSWRPAEDIPADEVRRALEDFLKKPF